jgi:hypothetical protein
MPLPLRGRRAASTLLASAAVVVCVAAVAAPSASAATPRCTVAKLRAQFKNAQAGAGNRTLTLVLTNKTRKSCSMFGYPGAQLLNAGGRNVPTDVVRNRGVQPRTIVVAPGRSAVSQWRWGAIAGRGEPTNGRCEPNPAKIEVTPPNDDDHFVLTWRGGSVCEHGAITVTPMALS